MVVHQGLQTLSKGARIEVTITKDLHGTVRSAFRVVSCYIRKTDGQHFIQWAEVLGRRAVGIVRKLLIFFGTCGNVDYRYIEAQFCIK